VLYVRTFYLIRFLSVAFLISVIVFCLPAIRADVQGDLQKQQLSRNSIKNELGALIDWVCMMRRPEASAWLGVVGTRARGIVSEKWKERNEEGRLNRST
jgi:hypothetical protein